VIRALELPLVTQLGMFELTLVLVIVALLAAIVLLLRGLARY
jgi:hypothetical protein